MTPHIKNSLRLNRVRRERDRKKIVNIAVRIERSAKICVLKIKEREKNSQRSEKRERENFTSDFREKKCKKRKRRRKILKRNSKPNFHSYLIHSSEA